MSQSTIKATSHELRRSCAAAVETISDLQRQVNTLASSLAYAHDRIAALEGRLDAAAEIAHHTETPRPYGH